MKLIKLAIVGLVALSLFACNNGSDGSTSNDVQNISASDKVGNSSYNIVGLATNCRLSPNSCSISLTINTTGDYNLKTISYKIGTQNIQRTSYATNSTGQQQSYSFLIYGGNISNATTTTIFLGDLTTKATFQIGGGL